MADTIQGPPTILPKAPTGIAGLDEVTGGGLPQGRPTLLCGSAGCGKTILAMELLVRGATEFNEPGVFMAFEESTAELAQNVASLGWDLPGEQIFAAPTLIKQLPPPLRRLVGDMSNTAQVLFGLDLRKR